MLDQFAHFCGRLRLDSGAPMVLEPFQRVLLADFFAGTPESLVLLPKGNGKSTLLGALAIFHVCTVEDAEVDIIAASREQAGILLRQASGFVRRSAGLGSRLLVKQREISHRSLGGRIRVLASDVDTLDGIVPTLGLLDELHRFKSSEPYSIVRAGVDKRAGQMLAITTAGSDVSSVLGQMRQSAIAHGARRTGRYMRAGGGSLVLHEWSLAEGDDPDDIGVVKEANPLAAITVAVLQARHDSPSTTPWDWARFTANVWTGSDAPWVPVGAWEACRSDLMIPEGGDVVVAIDIGRKRDSSAVVIAHAHESGRTVVRATVFESPGEGSAESSDLAVIEAAIREIASSYNVLEVAFDPWSFTRSAQILADEGLLLVEYPQSHSRMAPASARVHEAITATRIAHDGDPVLAAHVAAGAPTETPRGWRLTKRGSAKIDALIALTVAVDRTDWWAAQRKPNYIDDSAYGRLSEEERQYVDRLIDEAEDARDRLADDVLGEFDPDDVTTPDGVPT